MKKFSFFVLLFISTLKGFTQENKIDIGISGGPGLISFYGDKYYTPRYFPAIGFSSGLSVQYNFHPIFSFRGELQFDSKGSDVRTARIFVYIPGKGYSSGTHIDKNRLDYLSIPLLLRASLGKKIKYFANAGVFASYLLDSKIIPQNNVQIPGVLLPGQIADNTDQTQRMAFGVIAGAGLSIPVKQRFLISFELRENLGLSDLKKLPEVNGKTKTNSLNLLIGIAYKLGATSSK